MRTVILALGLMCLAEGFGPLFMADRWRQMLLAVARLRDGQIRFFGLLVFGLGVLATLLAGILPR